MIECQGSMVQGSPQGATPLSGQPLSARPLPTQQARRSRGCAGRATSGFMGLLSAFATLLAGAGAALVTPALATGQVVLATAAAPVQPAPPSASAATGPIGTATAPQAPAATASPASPPSPATAAPTAPALVVRSAAKPFVPPAQETLMAGAIDVKRMAQTVHDLVQIGPRMGGTPSGDRAAAYLAAAFKTAGVAVEVVEDPPHAVHWEDSWSVQLETGGKLATAYPYGFSPSLEPVTAQLVVLPGGLKAPRKSAAAAPPPASAGSAGSAGSAAGTGSAGSAGSSGGTGSAGGAGAGAGTDASGAADDNGRGEPPNSKDQVMVPHPEWRGKVLFVPGNMLGAYAALATGADRPLAILTSAPGDGRRYLDSARLESLPAPPGAQVVNGVALRPIPVFAVSWQDGERLTAAGNGARVHLALRSTVRRGQPRTVVATVPGRDNDHYYLICAHGDSDSGGPGADDNGSGEAVVLELARAYTLLIREGRLAPPRVALRFAIWGSEYASSEAYVAREGKRLGNCLGVLNLDEVGTGAERNALYFESNEIPWNRTLLGTLNQVGADYVGRPGYWPEYTTNPSQGGTDSYAFLPQAFQGELPDDAPHIPATTVYTAAWDQAGHLRQTPGWESPGTPDPANLTIDYSRYYHASGDTPENTTDRKPQAMVSAARALGIALLRLAFPAA
jgi:uncharacterized membrane protein YgcG